MEDIKKNRRSIKEIKKDMLKIIKRRPTEEELIDLVKIINENAIPEDEIKIKKIAIKRENHDIEQNGL